MRQRIWFPCVRTQSNSSQTEAAPRRALKPQQAPAVHLVLTLRMGIRRHSNWYTKRYTFAVRRAQIDAIAWLQGEVKGLWRGMQESNLRPPVS